MLPTLRTAFESPFDMLRDIDRQMSRAWREGNGPTAAQYPVDIHENENQLVVEAELPGFRKDEVSINVEQGVLTIEATREPHKAEGEEHLRERRYTRVFRRFSLPSSVDTTAEVDATLDSGVLTLRLPKRDEVKPRKIEVK